MIPARCSEDGPQCRFPKSCMEMERCYLHDPAPPVFCSKCGKDSEDTEWGVLTDVSVVVAENEEGYAYVTQLLCDECFDPMIETLTELGFVDHFHGSTNHLEDTKCCGGVDAYSDCPTPSKWGKYTVVHPSRLEQ